jgi:hypothetical protein
MLQERSRGPVAHRDGAGIEGRAGAEEGEERELVEPGVRAELAFIGNGGETPSSRLPPQLAPRQRDLNLVEGAAPGVVGDATGRLALGPAGELQQLARSRLPELSPDREEGSVDLGGEEPLEALGQDGVGLEGVGEVGRILKEVLRSALLGLS